MQLKGLTQMDFLAVLIALPIIIPFAIWGALAIVAIATLAGPR